MGLVYDSWDHDCVTHLEVSLGTFYKVARDFGDDISGPLDPGFRTIYDENRREPYIFAGKDSVRHPINEGIYWPYPLRRLSQADAIGYRKQYATLLVPSF